MKTIKAMKTIRTCAFWGRGGATTVVFATICALIGIWVLRLGFSDIRQMAPQEKTGFGFVLWTLLLHNAFAQSAPGTCDDPRRGPGLHRFYRDRQLRPQRWAAWSRHDGAWDGAQAARLPRRHLPAAQPRPGVDSYFSAVLTDSEIVPALTEAGLPFVLIKGTPPGTRVSCVDVDNAGAARAVVRHLAGLGHRRIALLLEGVYTRERGCAGMKRLLGLSDPPTAVFAGGDGIAAGACRACAEADVSVPGQVSIVGFDDAPNAQDLTPPLTTMRHPLTQIGATAATVLLDRLEGGAGGAEVARPGDQIILRGELIIWGSTAAPPPP